MTVDREWLVNKSGRDIDPSFGELKEPTFYRCAEGDHRETGSGSWIILLGEALSQNVSVLD